MFTKDLKLNIKFSNIDDFYTECRNLTDQGNKGDFNKRLEEEEPAFYGAGLEEILNSKYSSKRGNELFDNIIINDIDLGSSRLKKKWDETDGDDMSLERLHDGLPFLDKRTKTEGDKRGKFIELKVVISENCNISYKQMLHKSVAAINITDFLENQGYRVKIIAVVSCTNPGQYERNNIDFLEIEVPIKEYDTPIIKPLLLTTLSPWFFRYWVLLLFTAKFNPYSGMGQSCKLREKETKNLLIINNGECLTTDSVKEKLNSIEQLFSNK